MDTLVLSSWFRLLRPIADFHRLANTHAGRTPKKATNHMTWLIASSTTGGANFKCRSLNLSRKTGTQNAPTAPMSVRFVFWVQQQIVFPKRNMVTALPFVGQLQVVTNSKRIVSVYQQKIANLLIFRLAILGGRPPVLPVLTGLTLGRRVVIFQSAWSKYRKQSSGSTTYHRRE